MKRIFYISILSIMVTIIGCDRWGGFSNPDNLNWTLQNPVRIKTSRGPLVYIINDKQDSSSKATSLQIAAALNYSKIPYSIHDANRDSLSIPETVETICLTNSDGSQIDSTLATQLVTFVGTGHNLIIAAPNYNTNLYYLEGIDPSAAISADTTARGIIFRKSIFPGFPQTTGTVAANTVHGGIGPEAFQPKVKVLATAANNHSYPVLLKNRLGRGNVFLYNTYGISGKDMRGLLFSTLIRTLQGIPYNVTDVSTIFLDDFPEAVYKDTMPPIQQEYNISSAEFVKRKWWPDMKALADSLGLRYTAMLTNNYNSIVVPPFDFDEWTGTELKIDGDSTRVSPWLARDVLDTPHELGYHGYNHISLLTNRWPNETFMVESIRAARKRWLNDNLGPLPVTYVPPNDFIDSTGLAALAKGMPSIRYICSTYIGDVAEGSGREFSIDPYVSSFFDYPRVTDGYYNTAQKLFDQHSVELMTGIWTHFIHPDDVYDIPGNNRNRYGFSARNPLELGWRSSKDRDYGLYDMFRKRIIYTQTQYPLLRFKPAKEAVSDLFSWRSRSVIYKVGNNAISLQIEKGSPAEKATDWFMYVPASQNAKFADVIAQQADTVARSRMWNGYLYQFRTKLDSLHFPRITEENENHTNLAARSIRQLIKNYHQQTSLPSPVTSKPTGFTEKDLQKLGSEVGNPKKTREQTLNQYVTAAVSLNHIPRAIEQLRKRLILNRDWSDMTLLRLLTFLGWQNDSNEIWHILDTRWKYYPDKTTLKIKDKVVNRLGWPDAQTREEWFRRESSVHPDEPTLLRRIIMQNGGEPSWYRTKSAIKKLIKRYPRSDTLYALAVQRSLANEPADSTLAWVQQFPPNAAAQLKPFSDEIAWLYADRQDYVRAEEWANKSAYLDPESQLYWLMSSQRYNAFQEKALQTLNRHPNDDSLRIYIGTTLLDAGYNSQAYSILYPLFKKNEAPPGVQASIQSQIQGMTWTRKKQFIHQWPAFFDNDMIRGMDSTAVRDESFTVTPHSSITKDNYNNEVARAGINASWGYTPRYTHTINAEDVRVTSPVGPQSSTEYLRRLGYRYERRFNNQNIQITAGAGALYSGRYQKAFPNITVGFSRSGSMSYLSSNLGLSQVMTTPGIQSNIKKAELNIYREDNFFSNHFRTAFSGVGRTYTNNVQSFEASLKGFVPLALGAVSLNPVGQISYSDASKSISSGIPYWTPNKLRVYGAGIQIQDAGILPLNFSVEGMRKYNSDSGYYNVVDGNISYRINKYLQIQINGRLSTSRTYRSNTLGLTIGFNIPKTAPTFNAAGKKQSFTHLSYREDSMKSRGTNLGQSNKAKPSKIMLIGQVEYQQTGGTLYNLPIEIKDLDQSEIYRTRTYYNGEFFAELPPGNYGVKLDTTFTTRELKISPEMQPFGTNKTTSNAEPDTLHFIIRPKSGETSPDSTRFVVRIKKTDGLSAGMKSLAQLQKQFKPSLQLQYQASDSTLWLSSPLFKKQEQAQNYKNSLDAITNIKSELVGVVPPYPESVSYFIQYASFYQKSNARKFLNYVQNIFPDRDSYIRIDPIRGVYQILSGPYERLPRVQSLVRKAKRNKKLKGTFIQFSPEDVTQ